MEYKFKYTNSISMILLVFEEMMNICKTKYSYLCEIAIFDTHGILF